MNEFISEEMDEIESKLLTNNAMSASEGISKLVKAIEDLKLRQQELKDVPEFALLKEKCSDSHTTTSLTALQGLSELVDSGIFNVSHTMSTLISLLSSTDNYPGIVMAVDNLLILDMKEQLARTNAYHCQFNLVENQHPLITILKHDKGKSWDSILNFIHKLFLRNYEIEFQHKIDLIRPVFIFIICDPTTPCYLKQPLLLILLKYSFEKCVRDFLLELISWQQLDVSFCWFLLQTTNHFMEVTDGYMRPFLASLAPIMGLAIKWLTLNGHDPTLWIDQLTSCLKICDESGSTIMCILTEIIPLCPALYINQVTELCTYIIVNGLCNELSANMAAAALLNWMVYSSSLIRDLPISVENILFLLNERDHEWNNETSRLLGNPHFELLKNTNGCIIKAVNIARMSDDWKADRSLRLEWLKRLDESDCNFTLNEFALFLSGILLLEENEECSVICLKLLLKVINIKPVTSFSVLCLVLFKLSRETNPVMQQKYIHALPKMAIVKENVPVIIGTIGTLKSGTARVIMPLIVKLHLSLWEVENRTYPYLHKILNTPLGGGEEGWEMNVSKAMAMKRICECKAELHGKDLVSLLSEVLNSCGDDLSGLPCAIAMDAITELCKAHVIDVVGTWRALQPKLSRDKRPEVMMSLCRLFGEVPGLRSTGPEYEQLTSVCIVKLWSYVISEEVTVVRAALAALGRFKVEDQTLKALPDMFRRGLRLPKEYAKTPMDAARKPEDVLPYVPGECWVQLLEKIRPEARSAAGDMLVALLEEELKGYPRGVYLVPLGAAEPETASYLPPSSIARALLDHLRLASPETQQCEVTLEALRVLGHNFQWKLPLPPLNWSFLKATMELSAECKEACVTLLAKQGASSQSAKLVIETYVKHFTFTPGQIPEAVFLLTILSNVCNAVQPNSLRPFVEQALRSGIESALSGDVHLFQCVMSGIQTALSNKTIHEANRTLLANAIEGILPSIPPQHQIMSNFADCATVLPSKHIERMTSPSVWWEVSPFKLQQSIAVRTRLSLSVAPGEPLWLNECIDAAASLPREHTNILRNVATVLEKSRHNPCNARWLLELMGRTQASLGGGDGKTSDSVKVTVFFLNVCMVSVVVLSGHSLLCSLEQLVTSQECRFTLYPAALRDLLRRPSWTDSVPQIVEWTHRLSRWRCMPVQFSSVLRQSSLALRSCAYCKDSAKWPRLFYNH